MKTGMEHSNKSRIGARTALSAETQACRKEARTSLSALQLLSRFRRQKGFTIIETGVYLAVFFVLTGAAYMAMYRGMDKSLGLRRNTQAIASTLQAGEHWRADIRKAAGPIQIQDGTSLRIPTVQGEINYRFETNSVWRRVNSNAWMELLPGVKTSQIAADNRDQVTAYRWEIELLPVKKDLNDTNRFHPLFTFMAVPGQTSKP